MEKITSLQNTRIKNIIALQEKSRERRKQQLFVIEGFREINLAIEGGYVIQSIFACTELSGALALLGRLPDNIAVYETNKPVFDKIAYRENSDGLLALAIPRNLDLNDIKLSDNLFVIILEAIEKPGNLGAILRTADAAKVDAVIVCDPLCDVYNSNVIRSSIGCLFTNQVVTCTSDQALKWLHNNGILSYATELTASQWYHQTDMAKPCAIVMGTEADGLTGFWLQNADVHIKIPMRGKIDSLNVSVSMAILTFEAMRQRGFM
ncbi:MAG: RNA methyltransferase [Prevotellaceae bacterium]|jgi:TrmH family RNA methyltransferase|nr:RNA methyltransferase [Prevotellaceae bacterium]